MVGATIAYRCRQDLVDIVSRRWPRTKDRQGCLALALELAMQFAWSPGRALARVAQTSPLLFMTEVPGEELNPVDFMVRRQLRLRRERPGEQISSCWVVQACPC